MAIYTLPAFFRRDMISYLRKQNMLMNVSVKNMDVLLAIIESGPDGISARDISNKCDMTIYSVRYSLDKLETCNLIIRTPSNTDAKIKWIPGKHLIFAINSLQDVKTAELEC